jgi:hypothetical protein
MMLPFPPVSSNGSDGIVIVMEFLDEPIHVRLVSDANQSRIETVK